MFNLHRRRMTVLLLLTLGLAASMSALVGSLSRPPGSSAFVPLGIARSGADYGSYPATSFSPPNANGIINGQDAQHDTSLSLRDMPLLNEDGNAQDPDANLPHHASVLSRPNVTDPAVERNPRPSTMPTLTVQFNGIAQTQYTPPDTNGEAGLTQYVQVVNAKFQVWDKQGNSLFGPANINTIWQGFGGPCQAGGVDPILLYDQLANRWLISVFTTASPYYECIAISTTSDATGAWHRYAFVTGTNLLPDYPKLGMWPDAYYMSTNAFDGSDVFQGAQPWAFDRAAMLTGATAAYQTTNFLLGNAQAMLPSDLDGSIQPSSGSPVFYITQDVSDTNQTLFTYHVDWNTPANSVFTTTATLSPAPFNDLCPIQFNCVPQPGTGTQLEGLAQFTLFRGAYRIINGYDSLVYTYNVDRGDGVAGVRWYELRNLGPSASYYQQGTYAPDSTYRWMGSAAMDRVGNIALGYSASSSTVYPSIYYAGRLDSDPLGQLAQGEAVMTRGNQSTNATRWGDYSDMTIDPTDDCTFWYTTEYLTVTTQWKTRIGAFKFPNCTNGGATPTPLPATATPTQIAPTATLTQVPTTATPTQVPATDTPVPTDTPAVTDTPMPTNTAVVTATPTDCPLPFVDINGNTFYTAIKFLYCRGVVSGVDATHYGPAGSSTRAQFAKVVVLGFSIQSYTPTTPTFTDVPSSYFAYGFIEAGYRAGILSGFDAANCASIGATFPCYGPNRPITRAQLTKLVVAAAGYPPFTPTLPTFSDVGPSNVFYVSIETAANKGVVGGYPDGTFRPNNNIRRDEMAQIVYKGITTP